MMGEHIYDAGAGRHKILKLWYSFVFVKDRTYSSIWRKITMNHCGTQKLETGRLILRRLTMADADAMYRNWASDPEVTRFLTWPVHTNVEVTKHVIGTWLPLYEKQDHYHWAITLKENGDEPIGTIHGQVNDDLEQITVGYCLGRAWWHRGIMSETLQAVIDFPMYATATLTPQKAAVMS